MIVWLVRHRRALLVALVVLTTALALFAGRAFPPDNALQVFFLDTDPQLRAYRESASLFGNDEVILLLVEAPEGVFTAGTLRRLLTLTAALEAIPGVARADSVMTLRDAREADDGLRFERVVEEPLPESEEDLRRLEADALASPLVRNRLVSADGKKALLVVQMAAMEDIDTRRDRIVAAVRQAAAESFPGRHALGGVGVIHAGLDGVTRTEMARFASLGYALMFIALFWVFRRVRLVLAALGVILLATAAALGAYGLAGHRLNLVTMMLPTLMLVLGIADAVHFPAAFAEAEHELPEAPREESVARALRSVLFPCAFNTATTAAGFLGLLAAPMAIFRSLGAFAALGLLVALAAAVVLMLNAYLSLPKGLAAPRHPLVARLLEACFLGVTRHPRALAVLSAILVALSLGGALRLRADTYTLGYLPKDDEVVRDHERIVRAWGDYGVLEFTVVPAGGRPVDSPEVLAGMERFVTRARERPEIRDGLSVATLYRRMASALGSEPAPGAVWPRELVAQLRLFVGPSGFAWERDDPAWRDNFLAPLVTEDGTRGRLTLVCRMMSAVELGHLLDHLAALGEETLAPVARLVPSGYPPLYVRIVDYITRSEVQGFFTALAIVLVLMLLWLRSLRLTLVSLAPNLFPVVVLLGVMGAFHIPLDVGTACVAAIVIGVSFDDTVHYIFHWREGERRGLAWADNVRATFAGAGTPATVTSLLLLAGYPILMLSGVATIFYFGLLTSVSAIAGLFGDLVILPLLLRAFPGGGIHGVR